MPEVAYSDIQDTLSDSKSAPTPLSSISVNDSQKLGQSSNIQYTQPKPLPEPNIGERIKEDVEKPFIQAQHAMGSGLYWLGSNIKDETPFGGLGDRIARAGIIQQERATESLQKNFSNFKSNMLDDLVGAVPTVGALIGAAAIGVPSAIVTGGVAGTFGLGIAAEEFNKFKEQGKTTPEANTLAAAIGVPTTGVMALGFGVVGKLVEPWFKNMLGATIAKIASQSASGAAALGAQALTTDTGEYATGAEPFKGKESIVKTLTDVAHNAIFGGVLSGTIGMGYTLRQHNNLVNGLKDLGLSEKEAHQIGEDILGQGSHVLMDAIEKHLDYSSDELARVQATPSELPKEVRPNILEKGGIPNDLLFPSLEPLPKEAPEVVDMSTDFKYVKLEPLDLQIKLNDKATADDIRSKFVGGRDKQWARGVYLNQDLKALVPDEIERKAMFWATRPKEFLDLASRDPEGAKQAAKQLLGELHDLSGRKVPDITVNEIDELTQKLIQMRPELEKAANPSENMITALKEGKQYYDEAGLVSKAFGTIDEILENYHSSRLYKSEPLSDYVKNLSSVTKRFSAHSLQRYFPDPFLAIAAGKEFHTTDFADALLAHNQEMTAVNYSRQMMDTMSQLKPAPLGQWVREGALPPNWQQIGTARKMMLMRDPLTKDIIKDDQGNQMRFYKVFASPKGIAEGLRPLTDPNYMKLIPGWKTANKIQGVAKTGILSFSFFHHATFAAQTMASLDGYKTLSEMPKVLKNNLMSEPAFREQEQRFLGANGSTTITHAVQDVLRDLNKGDDAFSKLLKAPVAKQLAELSDANTKLLFDGMQRYMKVTTFSRNMSKWEGEHPTATSEEIHQAELGYAKATNAEFGGLNWETLGVNRTVQALMRFSLLAPDWVVSNTLAAKYAFTDKGTAGSQARWTLASAVLGGIVLNNALNYMRTGHSTFENKKGHMFETEVSPDIYINSIRGAPGELIKVGADMIESQGAPGFARYAEGKLSPMAAAAITATSGVNYFGQNIWKGESMLQKNVNGFWNILTHLTPIPIGVTSAVSYAQREQEQSALGWGLISTGLGRFSKPSETQEKANLNEKVIKAYRSGNSKYIEHLIDRGDLSQDQAEKLKDESAKSDSVRHVQHLKIEKALTFYEKANKDDRKEIRDLIEEKYQRFQDSDASPNQKEKVKKLYSRLIK